MTKQSKNVFCKFIEKESWSITLTQKYSDSLLSALVEAPLAAVTALGILGYDGTSFTHLDLGIFFADLLWLCVSHFLISPEMLSLGQVTGDSLSWMCAGGHGHVGRWILSPVSGLEGSGPVQSFTEEKFPLNPHQWSVAVMAVLLEVSFLSTDSGAQAVTVSDNQALVHPSYQTRLPWSLSLAASSGRVPGPNLSHQEEILQRPLFA